jgi:hypothetical protein
MMIAFAIALLIAACAQRAGDRRPLQDQQICCAFAPAITGTMRRPPAPYSPRCKDHVDAATSRRREWRRRRH